MTRGIWFRFAAGERAEIDAHVRGGGVAVVVGGRTGILYASDEVALTALEAVVIPNRFSAARRDTLARSRSRDDFAEPGAKNWDGHRRAYAIGMVEVDRAIALCDSFASAPGPRGGDEDVHAVDPSQGGLFGDPVGGAPAPYHGSPPFEAGSDTSLLAAESMADSSVPVQRRIYSFIGYRGERGATDWEIEKGLGLKHQTASAARRNLELKGLVRKTDETRPTDTGRSAGVYVIINRGTE